MSAAKGTVRSGWVSWIAGPVLLAGLTFAIRDHGATRAETGVPPGPLLLDGLGTDAARARSW